MVKKKEKVEVILTKEEQCKLQLTNGYNSYMNIHNCCCFGMIERLEELLEDPKLSFDTKEKQSGNTPLILASKHGKKGFVHF